MGTPKRKKVVDCLISDSAMGQVCSSPEPLSSHRLVIYATDIEPEHTTFGTVSNSV
jgi:hypothetical protein